MKGELASVKGVTMCILDIKKIIISKTEGCLGLSWVYSSTQDQMLLVPELVPWMLNHNYYMHTVPPGLSPLLTCMLHCSVGCQVQTTRSKIKLLRISRWRQASITSSMGSFSMQDPVLLHRFQALKSPQN